MLEDVECASAEVNDMDVMARLAAAVCGRRAKWLVVGFWIAVMALAYPLSAKLMGAQDNDAASWLPGDAESTRVVELQQEAFATGDRLPAIVVYERSAASPRTTPPWRQLKRRRSARSTTFPTRSSGLFRQRTGGAAGHRRDRSR